MVRRWVPVRTVTPPMLSARHRIAALEVLFVLLWNSGFIGAELGLPFAGPFTLLLWRYVALTVLMGLILLVRRRHLWPGASAAGWAALVGVLAHGVWLGCVLVALDVGVPAGIVALVTALQPLTTGALADAWVGEHTSKRQWVGLVLGFAGVVVAVVARIDADAATPTVGYLIPFGSVVAITVASLVERRLEVTDSGDRLPVDVNLFYQSVATALALVAPAVVFEGLAAEWTPTFVGTLAWLIVAVSLGAYALMWALLARVDATRVASLFYLSPPVTMVMAWIAVGDDVRMTDLAGLAVAAVGVALVHRPQRRP